MQVLDWGVEVIFWLQQASPALDLPFRALTFLGDEPFFLLLLPLVYWCVDRRLGTRLIVLFLVSAYVNALAKDLAGQPRPFVYDGRVQQLVAAAGGGFPSGHTQSTLVFWGYLALQARSVWLRVLAAVLIVLVPLSRMFLGVHFPTDLLGGYVIGGALLWVGIRMMPRVEKGLAALGLKYRILLALVLPGLLVALAPPGCTWCVGAGATLMGMALGFLLERRWVGFEATGSPVQRGLRFALGSAIMVLLWSGARHLLSGLSPETVFRFVRYALLGFWGAFGAPWLFLHCHLLGGPSPAGSGRSGEQLNA